MADIVRDLSPPSLAVTIKENLYAFFQVLGDSDHATVRKIKHGFRWYTSVAHPWFNGVLINQPPTQGATQEVRETIAYFESQDVNGFTWWLTPDLDLGAWSPLLLPNGFHFDDQTPGMAMDLADLPKQGKLPLNIRQVKDRPTLAEWASIMVQGFEMPESMREGLLALFDSLGYDLPIRNYIGTLNDEPVATSTLFLGAGAAGIYDVATLPNARGQGVGTAMTLHPLYEAREMGYRAGVLQSSRMGYRVYRKLGFQKLCQVDHFYRPIQKTQPDE